jgi:hypothetical protein
MGIRRVARAVLALVALPFVQAAAQTATFAGAVVRDTLEHGLPDATITFSGVNRTATTDAKGEFKITGLPAGRHAIMIRHIGFSSMVDTVNLVDGTNPEREYVMDPAPTFLDSVRVNATKIAPRLSATMSQFEDHRKTGFGHFVTADVLRKNDTRKLNDVLTSMVPGLTTYRPYPQTAPTLEYLSSGRGACAGPVFYCPAVAACPVNLYVNGVVYYNGNGDIPDIARFPTDEIEAVEYYAGASQVPQQYNASGNGCGVLVLWMRER